METTVGTGREFWQAMLEVGGATTIPRWTMRPEDGTADTDLPVPPEITAAVCRLGAELEVPLRTVLLAAHAAVLAALSGDREVTTGYVPEAGGPPLPCRLTTEPPSWRALVEDAHRTESAILAHRHFPVEELGRELGLVDPPFETVFDSPGSAAALPPRTLLRIGARHDDGRLVLHLRYRTDDLDADSAARIAGYHLTALRYLAAEPDADPRRQSLLSPEEVRRQLDDYAGPVRALPDRRFHELFEERAAAQPDATAAIHGDVRWTYGELNSRANRLGRALLARGIEHEGVVAVVTDRNLDWIAAVLAVLKAGAVYLPLEPHFPADRIATTLSRAGCRQVLAETGSTETLDRALDGLPGVERLLIGDAYAEGHADANLGVPVAPDQLAYIYFTSGSTGEPKGAMCEHAGMLNHLYAKIDDLGIGPGQVVAQTAPQCFDISLWQLVSGLLVGARTLIVGQQVVLDVERFIDTITAGRVAVLQVVPSYLEVVLTFLEQHPRELPDLRIVSVTGEALKKDLAQRWFATRPGIPLVNAYGLTETSDDTNHEVMHRVPDRDRVPLGRPINNVRVLVVDENLVPVPLGAPGEIAFTGICVGRGYVNDPERTRMAFGPDPYEPGGRLYRSGDHGRWLPDGRLEFLGRRDTQVKISGFRIEIGEVENTLLRVPEVRDGAVVVAGAAGSNSYLVAFHWREDLPLTANSKIDRKALTAIAAASATDDDHAAPRTPGERRLASAWAMVLGIPEEQIGRLDSFFDRGGTSLSAVKLAVTLDRAVSLRDITRSPVLADLAALLDARPPAPASPAGVPESAPGRSKALTSH